MPNYVSSRKPAIPFQGRIDSRQLQGYLTSLVNDVYALDAIVAEVIKRLSHGLVTGVALTYDASTKTLTVYPGSVFYNGQQFVAAEQQIPLDDTSASTLEAGGYVCFDPATEQIVVLSDPGNAIPIGKYVGPNFDYSVRVSLSI